ncbi:MAG TPA: undecaprenyl-diphosphate phosphatase [Candidatus Babeliales bacterium]|nr:undecaprenyl-diphosphate phosphatase [Candidatus Babeliales bacterium]
MNLLYWLSALQIILESFPISSSSHLILFERLMQWCGVAHMPVVLDGSVEAWQEILNVLHGPTVIVLALFFARRWLALVTWDKTWFWQIVSWGMLVLVADLCTLLFFFLFKHTGKDFFPLGLGLCVTAMSLLLTKYYAVDENKKFDGMAAIILGCAQGIALLPGISRFGFTFMAARWLQFSPRRAFELSFLIELPLIFAAFVKSAYGLGWLQIQTVFLHVDLILVMIAAMIGAWIGLVVMDYLINTNRMWWFSVYMILPITVWCFVR